MNLLQLVDEPYDSGIVHYALTLAQALQGRGHGSAIGARPGSFALRAAGRLGIQAHAVRRLPAGLLDLRRAIRGERIDLVNAHTGSSHTLAISATRLLRVPVVRTRADSRPLRRTPTGRLLWSRTAGFIAPTETILREFKSAYPEANTRACALAPGIEAPEPQGAPEPPSPPFRVGILGRLDPIKGHEFFLRAAALVVAQFPQTRWLIAGREENVRVPALRRLAQELGIDGHVEFLGHVDDAAAFMKHCHIGVIASIGSEAVSRAALEWMAVGRPIVATQVGGLPEIVEQSHTGILVPPRAPMELACNILELILDGELRLRMGQEGLRRFRSRFRLDRLAEETERFYEGILLSSSKGATQ